MTFIACFTGGVNAFSRYENCKTEPPLALVKLLKVLDRYPDLLDEVNVSSIRMYGGRVGHPPRAEKPVLGHLATSVLWDPAIARTILWHSTGEILP